MKLPPEPRNPVIIESEINDSLSTIRREAFRIEAFSRLIKDHAPDAKDREESLFDALCILRGEAVRRKGTPDTLSGNRLSELLDAVENELGV